MSDSPPTSPPPKPPSDRDDALAVVRRLREAGHVAYFAGGCVRDTLLGHKPKDFDVATDAPPQRVRGLFGNTQAVGAAFGVILVRIGRSQIEVATFRHDGKYLDGRRPSEVQFTTAEEDAKRRDFTINGLFLDPLKPGTPDQQVIDYVGGREDLRARVVRAIGEPEARFEEDHLRLLRAIRFASRFGFDIEPRTAEAIRNSADQLARISPERVGEELRVMLTPPTRVRAWVLLGQYGLKSVIFRFLDIPGLAADPMNGQDRFFDSLAPGRPVPFGLALAVASLEHAWWRLPSASDIRPLLDRPMVLRMTKALRQSLKISNEESEQMQQTLEGLAPLLGDEPPAVCTLKRFLARAAAPLSRELLAALEGIIDSRRFEWLQDRLTQLEQTDYAPPPLITGDDLTAAGLSPGPVFKKVLDRAYDEQLEGRLTTKAQALSAALEWAGGEK
jgi:poly(A) polymerase